MERAVELAYTHELTVFDPCYLALGELMEANVITADIYFHMKEKELGLLSQIGVRLPLVMSSVLNVYEFSFYRFSKDLFVELIKENSTGRFNTPVILNRIIIIL